ncbi:SDR family oxidoreductase [Candidatus Thorarchaeota archaeon]|nr:MAG: SDR family oxidoreductase [Candidatus Thorarchaeota archaeon]
MNLLEGKIAIITGVASGIGEATAKLFATEGAVVVGADIDRYLGSEVIENIREMQPESLFVHTDVSEREAVQTLVNSALQLGGVDILFNNAGREVVKQLQDTTEDEWDISMDTNLKSVYLCCKEVIPHMMEKGQGAIVNNSSVAGLIGSFSTVYSATKGGIIALSRALAIDLGPYGIRVNCICPGAIDTPMLDRVMRRQGDIEEVRARRLKGYPLGRFGRSEEVAQAVLFLSSDMSSFVTGEVLVVDGGFSAH